VGTHVTLTKDTSPGSSLRKEACSFLAGPRIAGRTIKCANRKRITRVFWLEYAESARVTQQSSGAAVVLRAGLSHYGCMPKVVIRSGFLGSGANRPGFSSVASSELPSHGFGS